MEIRITTGEFIANLPIVNTYAPGGIMIIEISMAIGRKSSIIYPIYQENLSNVGAQTIIMSNLSKTILVIN